MAKTRPIPSNVTLRRFSINPDKLPQNFEAWVLDFPFGDAVWNFKQKIENRIGDKRNIPYRQLSNALVTVNPSLVYGFEYTAKNMPYRALAITQKGEKELPEPENIRHVIRAWAQLWAKQFEEVDKIPADELQSMRMELLSAINKTTPDWAWRQIPNSELLDPKNSLSYNALPSLLAASMHNRTSIIHGRQIQWRKVQDSEGKKLSVVGFINQRPIKTGYALDEYQMKKQGEGIFAYEIDFNLQTQVGRNEAWMFVSLHAQRYADQPLTDPNKRRRVSILTAPNRTRLDDVPVNTTLVKLRADEKEGIFEWDDKLVELLESIGATSLESPSDIFNNPVNYWHPVNASSDDLRRDEYYIIHAEGYGYGSDKTGHSLEAGFSMTDSKGVFDAIITEHLTMLEADKPLPPDKPNFSATKTPRAMRDFTWVKNQVGKHPEKVAQEVKEMLNRALQHEKMHLVIFYHNDDTRDGLYMALKNALLLDPDEPFPDNLIVDHRFIPGPLLEPVDTKEFDKSRHQREMAWRTFLREQLPDQHHYFAVIELLKDSRRVKGAVRAACAVEGITSQMVKPISLKRDQEKPPVFSKHENSEHRANTAAREITIRHLGGMYGSPQEIISAAGIRDIGVEVVAFYLKQKTINNLSYPLAVKITPAGTVEVLLPGHNAPILYRDAGPVLGQLFAGEYKNTVYAGNGKRKIKDNGKKGSALYHEKFDLSRFVVQVLKNLQHPTIALIEAEVWRNYNVWPQISNAGLSGNRNVLDFSGFDRKYQRDDPLFRNLLGIIRMRSGNETPQYTTDTEREFTQLTGAVDTQTGDLMHYFSIGKQLITSKGQRYESTRHATALDGVGAGVAYKYPQIIEFVPFFVREDYQTPDGLTQLCRVPHYLRISPAWTQGNIVLPYPMHLAQTLIDDQLCILGMD